MFTNLNRPSTWLLLAISMSMAHAQQPATESAAQPKSGPPAAMGAVNPLWPTISDAVDYKNDTEPARVNSINFYGNQKLTREQLLAVIGIKVDQVMQQELMGKGIEAIKARYAASGMQVEVRPRVSHPKQNFVDVNFLINEKGDGQ
ncbi:MAG: POTRA domain-containing protein [Steroidobacteraceae bacterium]